MPNKYERVYALTSLIALLAAVVWALRPQPVTVGTGPAVVNGVPIPEEEHLRALDAMQAGLERALTEEDKKRALNVLVDEELLVQQAIKLNLAADDRLVRRNLIQAMIRSVTLLAAADEPTERQLIDLFEANESLFASPRLVTLEIIKAGPNSNLATFLTQLKTGATFEQARNEARLLTIDAPPRLPIGVIGNLFGATIRDTVDAMRQGEIVGPLEVGDEIYFLWLIRDERNEVSFEDAREAVDTEWRRRADEEALKTYLLRLRRNADVKINYSAN